MCFSLEQKRINFIQVLQRGKKQTKWLRGTKAARLPSFTITSEHEQQR